MVQNFNDGTTEQPNKTAQHSDISDSGKSLINRIDFEPFQAAGERISADAKGLLSGDLGLKGLGLPHLDVTGFEQEAPYHSQGTIKDLMHAAKHMLVKDDTLDDKVRSHVESKMSPEEQKKFNAENKAMDEYHSKMLGWMVSTMIPPPPMPEKPVTPMHQEIEKRAQDMEKQITSDVKSRMSPTDLKRLDDQIKDYQRKYDEATKIVEPDITGYFHNRELPKPGNAIKDYFDRVAEATEKRLSE